VKTITNPVVISKRLSKVENCLERLVDTYNDNGRVLAAMLNDHDDGLSEQGPAINGQEGLIERLTKEHAITREIALSVNPDIDRLEVAGANTWVDVRTLADRTDGINAALTDLEEKTSQDRSQLNAHHERLDIIEARLTQLQDAFSDTDRLTALRDSVIERLAKEHHTTRDSVTSINSAVDRIDQKLKDLSERHDLMRRPYPH